MSPTLLLSFGAVVWAITVCATLLYAYSTFNHSYERSVAAELALRLLGYSNDLDRAASGLIPAPIALVADG